jgi:hypothetical protein
MKKCNICNESRTISDFWKLKTSPDGLQYTCKICQRKINKKHKEANKERVKLNRRKNLLKSYGLTTEDYDKMIEAQGGVCKICKDPKAKHWRTDKLFVDHDHKTGRVRGLLCHDCNYALGGFKDRIDLLKEAIKYLEGSNETKNR